MKLLTPRQLSGLVMLGNTFLPVIVALSLGLMGWSTLATLRDEACLIVRDLNKDLPPRASIDPVSCSCLDSKGLEPVESGAKPCGPFAVMKHIVTVELYGKTMGMLRREIGGMKKNAAALANAVDQSVSLELDLPDSKGLKRTFQGRFNKYLAEPLAKPVKTSVDAAANAVRKATYAVFQPQMDNMKKELEDVAHKRNVVWARTKNVYDMQLKKFYWFFVALAMWLLLSYVLWGYHRLSEAWSLIHGRETA
jgi:hypothetical protein